MAYIRPWPRYTGVECIVIALFRPRILSITRVFFRVGWQEWKEPAGIRNEAVKVERGPPYGGGSRMPKIQTFLPSFFSFASFSSSFSERMGKISITVLLFFKRELNIDRKIGERIIQGAKMICTTTSGIWSY